MDSQTRLNIANQLTREVLLEPNPAVSLLGEQGKVNTAFTIGTPSCDYILRIRFSPSEMRQFEVEKLCAELVRDDLGEDWTPRVLQIGQFEDVCYSFQEKVEGVVASKYQGDLGDVWEQVGGYAAKFHRIEVPGYGFQLFSEMTDKSDDWSKWNREVLGDVESSLLVNNELLTRDEFKRALLALERLFAMEFTPKLAHGNLLPDNLLVDERGKVHIIDWGTAQGHMACELDLAELIGFGIEDEFVKAYLRGYGLSESYVEDNAEVLRLFQMIRFMVAATFICFGSLEQRRGDAVRYCEQVRGLMHIC